MTTTERWFDVTIDCGGGELRGELTLDRLCYLLRDLAPNAYEVSADTKGHVFGGTAGDVLDALHTEFNPLTDARARTIACNWHGGQDSPLYALCSSGAVLPDVLHEIDDIQLWDHDRTTMTELENLRTYAELNIERGPVKGWADLWEDGEAVSADTFDTAFPVGKMEIVAQDLADKGLTFGEIADVIKERVSDQQLADHNGDLQEYIDHIWRVVTGTYEDTEGLGARVQYEQIMDRVRARIDMGNEARPSISPVSGGDHESPTYVFDATIHVRVYVSGFDNEPDARREAEFQIASLEFTDDDTDVTEFSIQDWNRLDPMPVSGGDHEKLEDSFFRTLTSDEEAEFRQWARANYTPGTATNPTWHPIVRDECERMNAEQPRLADDSSWLGIPACALEYDDPDDDEPNLYFCDACKRGIPDSEPIHTIEDGRTVCSTCYEDRSIPDDEPKADVWAVFVGSPNDRMEGPYDTREEAFDAALELIGGWYGDENPKPHVIATKFYGSGEGRAAWHVYEREEDEFDTRVLAQHIWIDTVAADTQFED